MKWKHFTFHCIFIIVYLFIFQFMCIFIVEWTFMWLWQKQEMYIYPGDKWTLRKGWKRGWWRKKCVVDVYRYRFINIHVRKWIRRRGKNYLLLTKTFRWFPVVEYNALNIYKCPSSWKTFAFFFFFNFCIKTMLR